jgi:hypothetical protein
MIGPGQETKRQGCPGVFESTARVWGVDQLIPGSAVLGKSRLHRVAIIGMGHPLDDLRRYRHDQIEGLLGPAIDRTVNPGERG